jgi:hypothetical protein
MSNDKHIPDSNLITDIKAFFDKYVALSNDQSFLLAHYVLHTWLIKAANVTPYLWIKSKEPQCGKTKLIEILNCLSRNARRADDMTAPVMFKIIARECSTLLIDEIDTVWSGSRNEPKRQVLNTGYRRGGSAWREQARELVEFSTFSCKVIAGIDNGFLPATVRDRCIPVEMERRKDGQQIERFIESRVRASFELENLLNRIMKFCDEFYAEVAMQSPLPMSNLSDRQDEITEPLIAIACVLDTEQELRDAITKIYATSTRTAANPIQIIFRRIYEAFEGRSKIFTEDLCEELGPMYNGRTLAIWLDSYGITPKPVRIGNQVLRGYVAADFEPAWSQHLGIKKFDSEPEDEQESDEDAA